MPQSIQDIIDGTSIIDVHEHHFPEVLLSRDVNLLQLFRQSYAGWTQRRAYSLPSEPVGDPQPAPDEPTSWEALAPFLESSGSNSFVRNVVRAVADLHGDSEPISHQNWERIDAAVREHHRQPGWCEGVFQHAGIERLITDPYTDPLLDSRKTLGANYDTVLRINAFACGWHPDSRDHNGNSAHALLGRLGLRPEIFDDYLTSLERLVAGCRERHQVALKNALAYDRHLDFDEPDEQLARQSVWQTNTVGGRAKSLWRFCRGPALPIGWRARSAGPDASWDRNHSRITSAQGGRLIERHPRTRFVLMHLAYPWSRDLLGMAFVYRNIWLDLTWSLLLSPSHFKLALHEAIEILPDDSRMMIGGDNWHVEETYGTMKLARRLIGQVLSEKLADGYFGQHEAERLAKGILRENAIQFFGLT